MPPQILLPISWLQLLLAALPLLALAQSPHYYCDTPGREYINRPTAFYLHTRPTGADRYRPGSRCAYYAIPQTPGALYFVQLLNVSLPTASVTILSNTDHLLHLDRGTAAVPRIAPALATRRGGDLTIQFAADDSDVPEGGGAGVVLLVSVFVGCPPGWTFAGGHCFGNAGAGQPRLAFSDAQDACRLMQANLLHVPPDLGPGKPATVSELFRSVLPYDLTRDNWIGLTDYTSDGQFSYYWLDGNNFYESTIVGCQSSKLGTNRNCKVDERCAFFLKSLLYPFRFVVMDKCDSVHGYTCFMPSGGASQFYSVPTFSIFNPGAWAWAIVIGCLFAIGVAIGVVYAVMRLRHVRRRASADV